MPPSIVLGRITSTAPSPKLAPAPRHRNVLGISTKLAAKNISDSMIEELTPRSLPSKSHCVIASYIVKPVRSPRPPDGRCLHPRPCDDPIGCFRQHHDLPDNSSMYRQSAARRSASGPAEA